MFRDVRYQTGELDQVAADMKKGLIPCIDVEDTLEYEWVVKQLEEYEIYRVKDIPVDKKARDPIKEPEFEFRAAFSDDPTGSSATGKKDLMYIDFYFEPIIEETYDPVGEM